MARRKSSPAEKLTRGRVWQRDDILEWARATGREIKGL